MADAHEELLNVYDAGGAVVGAMPRDEAKRSGLAVGAVNILLSNTQGQVLLQRRASDKENGGLWDKSVGGHVLAGEEFDQTAVREAGEELFDDPASPRVVLAGNEAAFRAQLTAANLRETVVFRRASHQHNLRDVRRGPDGALRNVVYHVSIYLGRTDVPLESFRPQASEIAGLGYFAPRALDEMLLRAELAPNMAFLWLTHAAALLDR
ncbi:MAG: NUDIX domain-containing protein [Solirubrobacterales bacterium]